MNEQKYKTIGDIFILYSQTLIQLIPISKNKDWKNIQLQHYQQYKLGNQLIKLLKIIIKILPLDCKQYLWHWAIPIQFYSLIFKSISSQINQQIQGVFQNFNVLDLNHNIDCLNDHCMYFDSLQLYFFMIGIENDLQNNRKILNPQQKLQRIQQIDRYQKKTIQKSSTSEIFYKKYYKKFKILLDKLMYVFQDCSQKANKKKLNNNQIDLDLKKINNIKDDFNTFQNIHINTFYLKNQSFKEKLLFISKYYQTVIKNSLSTIHKLKQIQLMCLFYLQQCENNKIQTKLQIYMILISIKIGNKNSVEGILQKLKIVFSFDKIPQIQFSFFIIYSIISLQDPQNLMLKQTKQLIDYLLKIYSKTHGNQKQYIKLAIFSSIYLYHKSNNIKIINRKQLLQKLYELGSIIQYINNIDILDYIIQLIWIGNQIKYFDHHAILDKNINNNMLEFQNQGASNLLESVFSFKEAENSLKQFIIKNNITLDSPNPSSLPSNSQSLQVPSKDLINLLQLLLSKRISLTSQFDHNQYFYNKLIYLLILTRHGCKFNASTLNIYINTIQQYCLVCISHSINQKCIRIIFIMLFCWLSTESTNRQNQWLMEAIVCLQLSGIKINYQKIQNFIKNNMEKFVYINKQLFSCILSYELVQIMSQDCRRLYDDMVLQWVENYENYIYNLPDTRKQKLLMGKRQRFIEYLSKKIPNK